MLPHTGFGLEAAAHAVRRRLRSADGRPRADRFTPPDWPRSRGPTPNPRRH